MKIKILSVLILTVFSFLMKSCGIPAPTETKVDFSSAEILKSFAVADSFGQNL